LILLQQGLGQSFEILSVSVSVVAEFEAGFVELVIDKKPYTLSIFNYLECIHPAGK